MGLRIKEVEGGVVFRVKVVPCSSRTAIAGVLDGMLKVKIAAQPEKGKANKSVIDFLAKKLGVRKNAVAIVRGRTNPVKTVQVDGISAGTAMNILSAGA